MNASPAHAGSLMLVDDTPANLTLLESLLTSQGYRARCFPRGTMALTAAAQDPPDLILLDVNMPGLDGYEVCRRLKTDPGLARIPVIFLSALGETSHKLKGFECGGADYVTKPFEVQEVLARIQTHLELRRLQEELRRHNARLDDQVRLRTRELAEAHTRLSILDRTKSEFLRLISHELRTPLNGLVGVGELLLDTCPADGATEALKDLFQQSRDRLLATVDDALLLAQVEADGARFTAMLLPLEAILATALARATEFARTRGVQLGHFPGAPVAVRGDLELCGKAVQALLETAVRFSRAGTSLRLAIPTTEPEVVLWIEATGRDIPAAALPCFFEVLAVTDTIVPGGDLGLAAPLAQRILSLFGATVAVQNLTPPGIRFEVRFQPPAAAAEPAGTPVPGPAPERLPAG